ncbi:MAG: hypothetical protein V4555_19205, partial [Acidobacteriota bacterium]
MGFFSRGALRRGRNIAGAVMVGLCCLQSGAVRPKAKSDAWVEALRARKVFEAQAKGRHSREDYARVMDGFRAVYHSNPGDAHAAAAVGQVAELLAEEGREFGDARELHEAAGQYEYLAKAYPDAEMAPVALGQALMLLRPLAESAEEAAKVRAQLLNDYPRSAAAKAAKESERLAAKNDSTRRPAEIVRTTPVVRPQDQDAAPTRGVKAVSIEKPVVPVDLGPMAIVSGIRHWSTATIKCRAASRSA